MTQKEKVLRHLTDKNYSHEKRKITPLQAMADYGIMRLSAIIYDLKKEGYNIKTEIIKVKNRYNESCHVAQYSLIEKEKQQQLF